MAGISRHQAIILWFQCIARWKQWRHSSRITPYLMSDNGSCDAINMPCDLDILRYHSRYMHSQWSPRWQRNLRRQVHEFDILKTSKISMGIEKFLWTPKLTHKIREDHVKHSTNHTIISIHLVSPSFRTFFSFNASINKLFNVYFHYFYYARPALTFWPVATSSHE